MTEVWKPILGFEGLYEVSDQGRVMSCAKFKYRKGHKPYWVESRILKPMICATYPTVQLCRNGVVERKVSIPILVLTMFVGPRPGGSHKVHACHNDGNPLNNRLENLRWDTVKGNHADRPRHGTDNKGEKHWKSVLTEDVVREIRKLQDSLEQCELARMFGVSRSAVRGVTERLTWKHVE